MKLSDIMRNLADMIDAKQADTGSLASPVDYESESGKTMVHEPGQQPDDLFLPPLQMKIELLKKAVGVDNVYDDDEEAEDEQNSYNELELIKRNAGINPVVMSELGDDEPLDS